MPLRSIDKILASATAAYSGGRPDSALRELGQVGARGGRDPRVHLLRGLALSAMSRHDEAIESVRRAVALTPAHAGRRVMLARAMHEGGRFEEALGELERATALDPGSLDAALQTIATLTSLGRHDDVRRRLGDIGERFDPGRLPARQRYSLAATIANAAPHAADPERAIAALRPVAEEPGDLSTAAQATAWAHIGRLCEHLSRYDEAFDAYSRMNDLHAARWDPDAHSRHIDKMIEAWTGAADGPRDTRDARGMVFIVGMMRSGTSLTEQMLAQLDPVEPKGETNHVAGAVRPLSPPPIDRYLPMPSDPAAFDADAIRTIATRLRSAYGLDDGDADAPRIVTDKQPYNSLYLPLIARALPGAKVVHCVRDPVDTCLSCHAQNYAAAHPYTARLEWLARRHRDHDRLMSAWRGLGDPEVTPLRYERLVSEPESALAPVLDMIGLAWDPAILDFHTSGRAVATASIHQVRDPLNTRSVGRHERFGARLDPLREALAGG